MTYSMNSLLFCSNHVYLNPGLPTMRGRLSFRHPEKRVSCIFRSINLLRAPGDGGGRRLTVVRCEGEASVTAASCGLPAVEQRFDLGNRIETGRPQHTLSEPVTCVGVGLHTGERATVKLFSAAAGEGRYFVCNNNGSANIGSKGEQEDARITACVKNVRDSRLSTCIGNGQVVVRTVEHLLSALEGLGVDNCRIEIEGGNEVPLLDGSAYEWVQAIEAAGITIAADKTGAQLSRRVLVIEKPVTVCHGDSFVAAFPSSTTRLTYGIDFPQVEVIGRQWFTWSPTDDASYKCEVAPARTFGMFEQIEQLRAAGLIKGGSLDNALVCSQEKGWLNPPLRFADEPCRHKLLDLMGDLALCASPGHPGLPLAHIIAFKENGQNLG